MAFISYENVWNFSSLNDHIEYRSYVQIVKYLRIREVVAISIFQFMALNISGVTYVYKSCGFITFFSLNKSNQKKRAQRLRQQHFRIVKYFSRASSKHIEAWKMCNTFDSYLSSFSSSSFNLNLVKMPRFDKCNSYLCPQNHMVK